MRTFLAALVLAIALPAHAVEAGGALPDVKPSRLGTATPLALQSLRGQVVYVDFWASWCVPCRLSMPALDKLYQRFRERGFTVVGVNKDVAARDAQGFAERVKVSFPLVSDGDDAVARAFDVKAMPSGYLVDRRGVVREVHRGFTESTAQALQRQVEKLVEEKP